MERNNDKNPVIALREIAAGNIDIEKLRDSQIANLQKNNKLDDITDENLYAENQESVVLEADYADSLEDTSFSPEEEIGFEADVDFGDDINTAEEDK